MSSEVKLFIHIDDDRDNNVSQRLDECPEKALDRCLMSGRACQWTLLLTFFVQPFMFSSGCEPVPAIPTSVVVHIPAHHEHPFRTNVNTSSGLT